MIFIPCMRIGRFLYNSLFFLPTVQNYFGYIRVSTVRQGERGVSLQEQKEAITRYSQRYSLLIVAWFEERETAAHGGRPVFNQMLKGLRSGKAKGVIIHK